jgi:hypothetical protein
VVISGFLNIYPEFAFGDVANKLHTEPMIFQLSVILIAFIGHSGPSLLFATDSRGWVEEDCSGATFHIIKSEAASAGQELVLRLGTAGIPLGAYLQGIQGDDWLVAEGKRCSSLNNCEEASQAKIRLNQMKGSMKHVSGKYALDLGGHHFEGEFVVKYRKRNPPPICE